MKIRTLIFIICCTLIVSIKASNDKRYDAIHSGTPWFDQNNREVNAHGACIVKEGNKYYLFGEYKSDTANVFTGFSCYSSTDLMNWKFERIVLPVQTTGLMGPNRVGERVKVMKCPITGEFVMYMHSDNLLYKDPNIAYATCKTINGVYQFVGPLLFEGKPIHKWDMGTFQDTDGKGYLLIHHGFIYELSGDYKSVKRLVINQKQGGEAPAIFKSKGIYYWLSSNLSSWEKNDNMYLTATSLEGPWTFRANFAPEGSLTWNSQTTFVLPVANKKDTVWMFMGDRWSFPRQGSAATYVWQPVRIDTGKVFLPDYLENWTLDVSTATFQETRLDVKSVFGSITAQKSNWVAENHQLKSNEKDASLTFTFIGTKVGVKALTNNKGGYARITIFEGKKKIVLTAVVDLYSKNEAHSQVFVSPTLEKGSYMLKVEALGEHPAWTDKSKTIYGSTDNFVVLEDVYVFK
ncbi:MAG: family 43 glycosylhydrolase [Paludibacter sp.]|nr:family 43 glycosylhydrolase [Paludibacter sp.]